MAPQWPTRHRLSTGARWKLRHDVVKENGTLAARMTALGGWLDLERRRLLVPPEPLAEILRTAPRADLSRNCRRSSGSGRRSRRRLAED